ncbi:ISL3 family transposase [Candidatus Poriferisodalis sp.]|uniref:ISL3 family transposase n=1 Tax=Candidatus Poriferisodalis sp. TaxID=3101277 RepID=UPI003AF95662
MARDVVWVRLWLAQVGVLGVLVDLPERLAVGVVSTVLGAKCPRCATPSGRVHDRRDNKVRDLEVSGRPVTLVWQRRRLVWGPCGGRFCEDRPAFEGRLTARLARRVVQDARAMTVNAAARRRRLGWGLVNALVVVYAGLVADRRRRRRCRLLLVEGTSIRRGHRYVTVLVNGDTGEVLAMVPHRNAQALSGFLASQGHRWCKGVKVVVSDGSKPYKAAIERRLGHARHVLDRYRVIRWFAAGLTAVRRDVQRRPEGSKPAFDPEVFRARFLLMGRPDTLDAAERARLDGLFAAHPRLKAAWAALGELHGLYLAKDRKGALEALDRFADIYRTGQIPEFSDIVDTFLAWHEEILDWHRARRPPNGRIDRTDNLLQVLRRKAHRFTNYANFEARGILITQPDNTEPSSPIPQNREGSNFGAVFACGADQDCWSQRLD